MKIKYTLVLALGLLLSGQVIGQKFGYLNSAAVLQEMPEVKEAEANLEVLQKQLQSKGQGMLQDFQAKYQELERKNAQGEISPKELDAEAAVLKEKESELAAYEQDMQNQMMQRREELLSPIIERVNSAIQQVAEEDGYTYIFDSSPGTGFILFADETTNVEAKVKTKLGL